MTSGVGELRRPALLERAGALAEVVRVDQHQLALLLPLQRALQLRERRGVDRVLGLPQRHRRTRDQRVHHLRHFGVELVGGVNRRPAQSKASGAGIRSANSAMRIARVRPTAAAINADAPPSGINPIFVNASMKKALSEAKTTSHASANDAPTPAAGPWTTATTGCGRFTIERTASLAASRTSPGAPAVPGLAWSSPR